jgi:nicotinamide phosphoribosyltransferase
MKLFAPALCDSYKFSHEKFQIKGTEFIYSNQTPRTSRYFPIDKEDFGGEAIFFGLQGFVKDILIDLWNDTFFNQPKEKVITKLKRLCDGHLGKDNISMERFTQLHDLGYLPIIIKALPEGATVPMKVPYLTIKNTHPDFAWITNYLETVISCEIWKSITTATFVHECRNLVNRFADETVGNRDHTNFQLHDFAMRGRNGAYDSAASGAAFLLSTWGSDSVPAIEYLENYYNANIEKEVIALSVPASEHAVSSLGTSVEDEFTFIKRAISEYYPTGIVSIVSDTYDYFKVITEYASKLKDVILNRPVNELGLSKVVFRPDSGDQVKIVTGWKVVPLEPDWNNIELLELIAIGGEAASITVNGVTKVYAVINVENEYKLGRELSEPEIKGTIECLWDIFSGNTSAKGYKMLDSHVGCILGDGCDYKVIKTILQRLKDKGFASSNMVFGLGSWSQTYSRDTLGIAQKATWAQVNGKGYELFKDPKTDDGMKKSARGLLRVNKENGKYVLKDQATSEEEKGGELKAVFENGKLLIDSSLAEIRARVEENVKKALA